MHILKGCARCFGFRFRAALGGPSMPSYTAKVPLEGARVPVANKLLFANATLKQSFNFCLTGFLLFKGPGSLNIPINIGDCKRNQDGSIDTSCTFI